MIFILNWKYTFNELFVNLIKIFTKKKLGNLFIDLYQSSLEFINFFFAREDTRGTGFINAK